MELYSRLLFSLLRYMNKHIGEAHLTFATRSRSSCGRLSCHEGSLARLLSETVVVYPRFFGWCRRLVTVRPVLRPWPAALACRQQQQREAGQEAPRVSVAGRPLAAHRREHMREKPWVHAFIIGKTPDDDAEATVYDTNVRSGEATRPYRPFHGPAACR